MKYDVRPRIRIVRDDGTIVIGPGKADLLEAIRAAGSIRAAAESLGMSYNRAWTLVRTMNEAFAGPLVEKERGGAAGGRATLTRRGESVLRLYRRMEAKAQKAIDPLFEELRRET